MLTYADARRSRRYSGEHTSAYVCWRMLTYADACWRMLTYAALAAIQAKPGEDDAGASVRKHTPTYVEHT
jgi:hypothetical protein